MFWRQKTKGVPVHAMKAYRGSGGVATLILDLGAGRAGFKCRWVFWVFRLRVAFDLIKSHQPRDTAFDSLGWLD